AREARKVVTVLFVDIAGSTGLGERLDPESLRGMLTRYFGEMRTIVERHGGLVSKFIGDAVMAVFGIPTRHEDDALRAVRAAWAWRKRGRGGGLAAGRRERRRAGMGAPAGLCAGRPRGRAAANEGGFRANRRTRELRTRDGHGTGRRGQVAAHGGADRAGGD